MHIYIYIYIYVYVYNILFVAQLRLHDGIHAGPETQLADYVPLAPLKLRSLSLFLTCENCLFLCFSLLSCSFPVERCSGYDTSEPFARDTVNI